MEYATLEKILTKDIIPTLTDFLHNQMVFWEAFKQNESVGSPIKKVMELGVYRIHGEPHSLLPGQSTKTLMALGDYYNVDKFISLDIDDCSSTIELCRKWLEQCGGKLSNHQFVQCNSMHFDVYGSFPNGIDCLFLDTNHDDLYPEKIGFPGSGGAGMTYKEICFYAKHLSPNGRLFLHDTFNDYVETNLELGYNTNGAVYRFIKENNDEFAFYEHNTNRNGLGEIYRKNSAIAKFYANS